MPRTLTLQNMDNVSLQGTFDYKALGHDPWETFYIQQDRKRRSVKEQITLGDVYRLFAEGLAFHEVKDALGVDAPPLNRDVENKTVLIGEAFYNAVHPGIKGFRRANVIKALCDENLDEHMVTHGSQSIFGYASHTSFESLTGNPDSKVWKTALQKYDIIISKDTAQKSGRIHENVRDLTNCAYDAWKDVFSRNGGAIDDEIKSLPIIIHIKDADATGREVKSMLKRNKIDIFNLLQQRKSPIISVGKVGKPSIGMHYLDLIDGGTEKRKFRLINARLGAFMSENPLNLTRREKLTQRSTIRSFIKEGVEDFIKQHSDAEKRIPALDVAIKEAALNSTMSHYCLENLRRAVHNSRHPKKHQFLVPKVA